MKIKKYYLLKRNVKNLLNDYLCEFSGEKRNKIEKRIKPEYPLLLIEKTCNKNFSESYTNLWTIEEIEDTWLKYTKNKQMYDYTGVVLPLIHLKGSVYTFNDYCKLKRKE